MKLFTKDMPSIRPVPVLYTEPNDTLQFPEFSHTSKSIFPLVSRKYFTNLVSKTFPEIQFVKAQIYYNASLLIPEQYEFPTRNHRKNSEIVGNKDLNKQIDLLNNTDLTYRDTDITMKGYHFYQLRKEDLRYPDARTPSTADPISDAFPAGLTRSHPAWDPSQHWILDVQFLDAKRNKIKKPSHALKLTSARFLKEYLKLYKSMEREAKSMLEQIYISDSIEIFGKKVEGQASYPGISYLRSHDRSIMLQEHKNVKDILTRAIIMDLVWDLKSDDLEFEEIKHFHIPAVPRVENYPAAVHYKEVPLDLPAKEEDDSSLSFLEVPESVHAFYQALIDQLVEREQDTVLEIHLRENHFLDKQSQNILENTCPVQEIFNMDTAQKKSNKMRILRTVIFQPKGASPQIQILEMDRYAMKVPDMPEQREWLKDRTKQWLPVFGQEKLPNYGRSEIPETREIARICKDFQKQIAKLVMQDEPSVSAQDQRDLKASLGNLANYVHPLLPVAWKERKLDKFFKEKTRIFLNSMGSFQNHWNSNRFRKEYYADLQHGPKCGILRDKDRKKYTLDILYNIAYTLQWPVHPDFHDRFKPQIWQLIQEFHPLLEKALEEFVNYAAPEAEAATLASQDPNLDFETCCAFLQVYPHCRSTLIRNPVLLQITAKAWQNNPSGTSELFYSPKHMTSKHPLPNCDVVSKITNQTREQNVETTLLHTMFPYHVKNADYQNEVDNILEQIREIPKAHLQKIVSGMPVARYRNPGMHFEVVDEWIHTDLDYDPEVNARNLNIHMKKLMKWLPSLALEHIPENPFEWEILFRTHLQPVAGNPDKTLEQEITPNFYPALLKRVREQAASTSSKPDPLSSWVHLHAEKHDKVSLNTLHKTINDHINIGHEAEEFLDLVRENADVLERYLHRLYKTGDSAEETIKEIEIARVTLENMSSVKRITDIHRKYSQHAPAMGQIDALAPHWPEKKESPSYQWDRALVQPILSNCGRYRVTEKNTAVELMAHGDEMSHCIGQYTPSCLREKKAVHVLAVWDLKKDRPCCTASIVEKVSVIERKKKVSVIMDALKGKKSSKNEEPKTDEDKEIETLEKVYTSTFEQREIAGVRNTDVNYAQMKAIKEAIEKMCQNAAEGLYDIRLAMTQRKITGDSYRKGLASMLDSQRAWATIEKWKVLRTVWSRLPDLKSYPSKHRLLMLDGESSKDDKEQPLDILGLYNRMDPDDD